MTLRPRPTSAGGATVGGFGEERHDFHRTGVRDQRRLRASPAEAIHGALATATRKRVANTSGSSTSRSTPCAGAASSSTPWTEPLGRPGGGQGVVLELLRSLGTRPAVDRRDAEGDVAGGPVDDLRRARPSPDPSQPCRDLGEVDDRAHPHPAAPARAGHDQDTVRQRAIRVPSRRPRRHDRRRPDRSDSAAAAASAGGGDGDPEPGGRSSEPRGRRSAVPSLRGTVRLRRSAARGDSRPAGR